MKGPVSELRLFYPRSFILLSASFLKENKVPFGHSNSNHLPPVLPCLRSTELFIAACKSCSPSLAPHEQASVEQQTEHPLPVSLAPMCLPQTPRGGRSCPQSLQCDGSNIKSLTGDAAWCPALPGCCCSHSIEWQVNSGFRTALLLGVRSQYRMKEKKRGREKDTKQICLQWL